MRKILGMIWSVIYPVMIYLIVVTGVQLGIQILTGLDSERIGFYSTIIGATACLPIFVILFHSQVLQCLPVPRYQKRILADPDSLFGPILAGIGVCIVGNFAVNLIVTVFGISSQAFDEAQVALFAPPWYVQVIGIGILVPVVEELIFRGMIFMKLRKHIPYAVSAVLSALLFGVFHGNIVQGMYAFGVGLLFAWADEWYGTVYPSILIHQAANLMSILVSSGWLIWLMERFPGLELGLVPCSVILLIVGIKMMRREGTEL